MKSLLTWRRPPGLRCPRSMKPLLARVFACVCVLLYAAAAQAPDPAQTIQTLRRELAARNHILADWAGLTRYGSENTEIRPPAPGENRVVFLGDDITEHWGAGGGRGSAPFFPGKAYLNRGISGQTTPQMLVRFRQDVILLKPRVVVIQAGANDLAGLMGPATEGTMAENFTSMVELAKANNIRVILASVTPVCDCFTNQTRLRPQGKIISLNGWIRDYAAQSGSVYLNYYAALADGRDFRKDLTVDGLLPNDAGYAVMAPLAEQAIALALSRP
jgi:lysophospholipase L1-like esterase